MNTAEPPKVQSPSAAGAPWTIQPELDNRRPSATGGRAPLAPHAASRSQPIILGDSANAVAAPERRSAWQRQGSPASRPQGRLLLAKAGALFVAIAATGFAEVKLLGLPPWVNLLYVALALAIALDSLRTPRTRSPVAASRWLETRTVRALPAPADETPGTGEANGPPGPDEHELAGLGPNEKSDDAAAEATRGAGQQDDAAGGAVASARGTHHAASEAVRTDAAADSEPRAAEEDEDDLASDRALPRPQRGPALGYTTVPVDGHGERLAQDTQAVRGWCAEHGVTVVKMIHDVEGSGEREAGPALAWALERIAAGEVDTLVVPRLQSLAPSVGNLPPLLRWLSEDPRALVALHPELDTATEAGRLAASALAGVGNWEKERLSARTRRGLEAARSRGAGRGGAAVAHVPGLRERITRMREEGTTLQAIADALNAEGVPTIRGGAKWRPSSVQAATGYRRPAKARGISVPTKVKVADSRQAPTPR